MSPAISMSTINYNNSNNNGSPLLRSPRRVKRDSTSLKHLNNSCGDLMEDLRQQLSIPIAPLLPHQDKEHHTVVLSILDDDEQGEEVEDEEDGDRDDSSKADESNASDCSSASGLAARHLLLQNTEANSAGQKCTRTKNAQASPQQQQQQIASRSSITNPNTSAASVASSQSIKSTRSLFSRLSRISRRKIPNQIEDSDDGTTVTTSSTKSWWKKRREQKKTDQADNDKKKKKKTIFQSFRLKRKRNKGRNVHQQLVADFFDVQSVASEPDFVGSGMIQQARWGTANGLLNAGDQHRCSLETRSVTSLNSHSHSFASFLLRQRQNDADCASQGTDLIGNHIDTHESDSEYDDEITLGSGFENMSLADSLDGSETAFHASREAAVAEAVASQLQDQCFQEKSEQPPLLSLEQPSLKAQSFLQRILNKTGSPGDDIIRKAILAASSQQPLLPRFTSTKPMEEEMDIHNVSLNSTLSESDSDDNPVKVERLNHDDDMDNHVGNDQLQEQENATIKLEEQEKLPMVIMAPVGRSKSLMQGNMAKAKSEHCLELVPNIADIFEYHPPLGSSQGNDLIHCSVADHVATEKTAESTVGVGSRWDSETSVASDSPLPKRPNRRITEQFCESHYDDRNSESAQARSLQQHRPEQPRSSQPQHQTQDEANRQEFKIHSAIDPHICSRPPTKPLASQSMRNLKSSDEEVDDESILSLLAGLLATWASEREAAAAEEVEIVVAEDLDKHSVAANSKNGGLKSILKNPADSPLLSSLYMESKEEEERDRGLRLSVTFDYVEIREYERVVGDNPSCTRGPPVAIGWIYQIGTICPVDDYETILRKRRRTKREFHLTAEQRTQILVDEWECLEEDIRRARREATYIQYCRAKTSFSGSRVAAKEAAFLRKANERTKIQQQQHQTAFMISGGGGTAAPPTSIPFSPTKSKRVHPRPTTPLSPSSRDIRPNVRKTGRRVSPPTTSSQKTERRAPGVSMSLMDRQNESGNSGNSTGQCAFPKTHPISPNNRPKTAPVSKYSSAPATLSSLASSASLATAEVHPTSRTLLEV